MQRVIDRTLYDTERAEQIAEYAPNADRGDLYYIVETLYKTTDGEYFLYCEGGAATKYAKSTSGGGTTSSAEINPLNEEAAVDWCEEQGIDGGIIVEEFGHLIDT